jgi:hypothetical protein
VSSVSVIVIGQTIGRDADLAGTGATTGRRRPWPSNLAFLMGNSDGAGRRVEEPPPRPSNVAECVQWGSKKDSMKWQRRIGASGADLRLR